MFQVAAFGSIFFCLVLSCCVGSATKNTATFQCNFGNGYFGTTLISSPEADDAGIGAFAYDVPAGYYTLCTINLGDQS